MAKMKSLVRRMLGRQNALNLKLRKAVAHGRTRQVAMLLDAGASATWMQLGMHGDDMNALLLACHYGNVEILNLVIDSFFETPQELTAWGRHMYCVVIRNGHSKAFLRLRERSVPSTPSSDASGAPNKLPSPAFIAAEYGQSRILQFLLKRDAIDLSGYSFNGHSLLSIASKSGHYECVEVLLSQLMVTHEMLDFAMDVARQHRQAHVLVLLTSCLPQYSSNASHRVQPSPFFDVNEYHHHDDLLGDKASLQDKAGVVHHNRGSLAETDILSDFGDDDGDDDARPRRSSAWLYPDERDMLVSHPYLEVDDDLDYEDSCRYLEYLRGLEDSDALGWTSTPPVSSSTILQSRPLVDDKRAKQPHKKWYYENEIILPYDESDESTRSSSSPRSPTGKPTAPAPAQALQKAPRGIDVFFTSPLITQVSRKVISVRSSSVKSFRSSLSSSS